MEPAEAPGEEIVLADPLRQPEVKLLVGEGQAKIELTGSRGEV